MSDTETMEQVYLLAQEHCGLKVGDWVRVTRKAENYEAGWDNIWSSCNIKNCTLGEIRGIDNNGIRVDFRKPGEWLWYFPYFVLEKVEKPVHEFKPFDKARNR